MEVELEKNIEKQQDVERVPVRKYNLAENVLIINGQPGCGKTMLSPIVAALDRVELLTYAYEIQVICVLNFLKKLDFEAAKAFVNTQADLQIYNTMMSREINFRPKDLSGIFADAQPWRYIKRLFSRGDTDIPNVIQREKPILHLTTHNLLSYADPILEGLGDRVTFVELVRHPLYMIKQKIMNMGNLIRNKRHFSMYFEKDGKTYPYWAHGWEDLFDRSNDTDKAIYFICKMYKRTDKYLEDISEEKKRRLVIIPFEKFVLEPWDYLEAINSKTGSKITSVTKKMLKKQKVPRKMYAEGINLKVYKRYGWQPPVSNNENEEFRLRRELVKENASKEALLLFDEVCREYEERYLGGAKNYIND